MPKTVSLISKNFKRIFPESLEEYLQAGGYKGLQKAISLTPAEVVDIVKQSDLRGRGGAAYPTGVKWEQAIAVKGDRKIIVCNADEGEPCTFKDRYLLEYDPFKIIEGMTIAAYILGAKEGYIYIREEYKKLQTRMRKVIHLALENGYLGENILGTGLSFNIKVASGAGAYVCGENSALMESLEGKSGRPRMKPPFIKEVGLYGLPTLINNVETFGIIPLLFSPEGEEYVKLGSSKSKGTKLISLGGNVNRPGVYEVPFGLSLREIIFDIGGGIPKGRRFKFLQIGGVSGPLVPESMLNVTLCYDDLWDNGLAMGSGAILVADETNSVVEFVKTAQDFFVHESCGKCTPCREGNYRLAEIMNRLVHCDAEPADLEKLKSIAKAMKSLSFCGLGKAAPTALLTALKYFPDEFQQQADRTSKFCMQYLNNIQ